MQRRRRARASPTSSTREPDPPEREPDVSEPLPATGSIDAAGSATRQIRRHRRLDHRRIAQAVTPYALIAPALAVIVAILGYPVYFLARLSFERYGLPELIAHDGVWVGFDNFRDILGDGQFWHVVLRTVAFTAVNVGLTMGIGTLIALLLKELRPLMRSVVTTALVLAWAMPVVVACQMWIWMTNYENGVVNYVLTKLGIGDFQQYDWFANTWLGFGVITSLIVWGAIPFVAITI